MERFCWPQARFLFVTRMEGQRDGAWAGRRGAFPNGRGGLRFPFAIFQAPSERVFRGGPQVFAAKIEWAFGRYALPRAAREKRILWLLQLEGEAGLPGGAFIGRQKAGRYL